MEEPAGPGRPGRHAIDGHTADAGPAARGHVRRPQPRCQAPEWVPQHGAAGGGDRGASSWRPETILYVLSGTARYRWGPRLENVVEAEPGSFVFIPAHIIHQEINASDQEATVWAVVRSDPNPIVVNLPELDHLAEPAQRGGTVAAE